MAKILSFDIETMPNLVSSWDVYSKGGWQATNVEQDWFPFSFGVKWYGQKTRYYSLDQYKGWKPLKAINKDGSITFRKPNVRPLLDDMWDYLNEADIYITWNGKQFDIKKLRSYFIAMGYQPFAEGLHIDVMREKNKLTNSNYNSLDKTGEEWGTGRKVEHAGFPLWDGCRMGDKKSLRLMKKYCIQDVDLTERNYDHLKPWMARHPAINTIDQKPDACPVCGESRVTRTSTFAYTTQRRYYYWRCLDCKALRPARAPEDSFVKNLLK